MERIIRPGDERLGEEYKRASDAIILFERERLVINMEAALVITGRLQHKSGVIQAIAEEIVDLPQLGVPAQASHDCRQGFPGSGLLLPGFW